MIVMNGYANKQGPLYFLELALLAGAKGHHLMWSAHSDAARVLLNLVKIDLKHLQQVDE